MKAVFLGPPGAGKGTQAKISSGKLRIPHISTGDIFRENIRKETPLGKKAIEYNNRGLLVPDELTNAIVKSRLSDADCREGFILDGYPRTIPQAEFLDSILKIDKVVNFNLDDNEIVRRISGRRTCKSCHAAYHVENQPPKKAGICDRCGAQLVQRDDEKPDIVKKRLEVYKKQTEPLIDYYRKKGILVEIDSTPGILEVGKAVEMALNDR